jgi:hypothetical protein
MVKDGGMGLVGKDGAAVLEVKAEGKGEEFRAEGDVEISRIAEFSKMGTTRMK